MKKILHFTIANTGSGMTKFILSLWENIDRKKYHFDFVTMSKHLDFAEQLEKEGCKIYYLSTYAEEDKRRFTKEVEAILDNGYDVVHLHTSWWRGFALEEIAQNKGIKKIIIHCHNSDVHIKENERREESRKLHFKQRNLLTEDMATDFVACSQEAAEWLYGDRISKDKIQIIPNAIETERFKYNPLIREEYRDKLQLKQSDYVIGNVGRFAWQKNHEFLIEVFYEISRLSEHAKLVLIGIGELEKEIQNRVSSMGLQDKALFLGKRDDVAALMQAIDVFVLPSRFEGFPIALIEAQAAGLKCIASDKISEASKITDNVIFLPFDIEQWVNKVLKYSEGYERKDMSDMLENAGYGMKTLVGRIEDLYEGASVISEGGGATN